MSYKHDPAGSLADIVENAERIATCMGGTDQFAFEQNGLARDGVERCLERICEAIYRLGDRAEQLMPAQPFREIRGMGNHLRHAYERIELAIHWSTADQRVPELAAAAQKAVTILEPDGNSTRTILY